MSAEFKQRVRMAAVQVSGLSGDDLKMALAYEVEPFSGIPAVEAEVQFECVADADTAVRVYDVTITRKRKRGIGGGAFGGLGGLGQSAKPALIFAGIVILTIAVDFAYLSIARSRVKCELKEREPLQAEIDVIREAARKDRDATAQLRRDREARAAAQERCAELRAAYPEVFKAIARAFGGNATLKSFIGGGFQLELNAFAVSEEAAIEAMTKLDGEARKCGWNFRPGVISAVNQGSSINFEGELWK